MAVVADCANLAAMCVRRCVVTLGALATVAFGAGCSDDEVGGSTVSAGRESSVGGSAPEATASDSGTPITIDVTGTSTSTNTSPATSPTTTAASSTVPPTTQPDPFASAPPPDPTEPDDMPGPPADDCVDAPAGVATVELTFDDDRILYAGATAPSCVRVHAAQRIGLRSTSGAASTVVAGSEVYEISAGATATTPVLSSLFAVGDVFDVYVEHLDTTVVVQVLP